MSLQAAIIVAMILALLITPVALIHLGRATTRTIILEIVGLSLATTFWLLYVIIHYYDSIPR